MKSFAGVAAFWLVITALAGTVVFPQQNKDRSIVPGKVTFERIDHRIRLNDIAFTRWAEVDSMRYQLPDSLLKSLSTTQLLLYCFQVPDFQVQAYPGFSLLYRSRSDTVLTAAYERFNGFREYRNRPNDIQFTLSFLKRCLTDNTPSGHYRAMYSLLFLQCSANSSRMTPAQRLEVFRLLDRLIQTVIPASELMLDTPNGPVVNPYAYKSDYPYRVAYNLFELWGYPRSVASRRSFVKTHEQLRLSLDMNPTSLQNLSREQSADLAQFAQDGGYRKLLAKWVKKEIREMEKAKS